MDSFSMDNVVLSEWPDDGGGGGGGLSAMDLLHGSSPWMPAYGFHHDSQPVLEKEDFLDSADADLFLHNSNLNAQHYIYLETIQEETSDDLQSESDRSESRTSPQDWPATDSETGSVIRISILESTQRQLKSFTVIDSKHILNSCWKEKEVDSGSEREIACPAKRRRQDLNHLTISDDESSLSRSSSLLQFENLEKQCQDISSSSPSIFSNFSYDSLENQRHKNVRSPDSLDHPASDTEQESSYYKMLKIDLPTKKGTIPQRDSLFYNATCNSESSASADSDETLQTPQYDSCKSVNNLILKTWRSFDCLTTTAVCGNNSNGAAQKTTKMSTENLSEDSGYSDNFCNGMKCNSIPNVLAIPSDKDKDSPIKDSVYKTRVNVLGASTETKRTISVKNKESGSYVGFDAYDGDVHPNFTTNFGVSYQDLSAVDKYDATEYRSPLIDRFMKNGAAKRREQTQHLQDRRNTGAVLNIDNANAECAPRLLGPKITATTTFASVPNLQLNDNFAESPRPSIHSVGGFDQATSLQHHHHQQCFIGKQHYFQESVCVSSVPNDLNLAADLHQCVNKWSFTDTVQSVTATSSIAEKNWDIGDLAKQSDERDDMPKPKLNTLEPAGDKIVIKLKHDSSSVSSASDIDVSSFIRESSYLEAMANSIDTSDDERKKIVQRIKPKTSLAEFDQRILKAISETSMNSFSNSTDKLHRVFSSTPISNQQRNVISTPNLSSYETNDDGSSMDNVLTAAVRSKGSIERLPIYHSTSTSGMSAEEDSSAARQQLLVPTKSFTGSTSSKGVHFSPVVSEVNWQDDSESTIERESSYSLSSTPERELNLKSPQQVVRPTRMSVSQPELQKVKRTRKINAQKDTFAFGPVLPAISQPEMGLLRRDDDGNVESNECEEGMGRLDLQATKNYVVKRYLSYDDESPRTHFLYNRSPTPLDNAGHHQRSQQKSVIAAERCASASTDSFSDRRAVVIDASGRVLRGNSRDAVSTAAAYASTPTLNTMDSKKNEKKKKDKDKQNKEKQTTAQRIGGLWHKFSSFRFSTRGAKSDRKGVPPPPPASKDQMKKDNRALLSSSTSASSEPYFTPTRFKTRSDVVVLSEAEGTSLYSPTGQRYATKDDYIHIPLHGPGGSDYGANLGFSGQTSKQTSRQILSGSNRHNNNLNDFLVNVPPDSSGDSAHQKCVSGKPPLPVSKEPPPRVIGLSMKTCSQSNGQKDDYPDGASNSIDRLRQKPPRQHHRSPPSGAGSGKQQQHQATTTETTAVVATTSSTPMGLIETDLDTEVTVITSGVNGKTRSLMNLGATESKAALRGLLTPHRLLSDHDSSKNDSTDSSSADNARPHKSMEFLLDKQNLQIVEPPENNLQKLEKNSIGGGGTGTVMLSEHELRVMRSYNRINVPDWFRRYQQQRPSAELLILPRKSSTSTTNSTSALHHRERWPPSVSTLPATSGHRTASFSSLATTMATTTQQPLATPYRDDQQQEQQFVRWSKNIAKLGGSAASSPCQSTRSSFNLPRYPYHTIGGATTPPSSLRSSFNGRTPYMGWRSQEKLNRTPRTPAERLTNSILLAQEGSISSNDDELVPVSATEDIIQVTTAIDQFVHDSGLVAADCVSPDVALDRQQQSQRQCWMESSFVGAKPLDAPQTPVQSRQNDGLMLTGLTLTSDALRATGYERQGDRHTPSHRPSLAPDSTTLEDVLDSLLGLPAASRATSPRLGLPDQTGSANNELTPLSSPTKEKQQSPPSTPQRQQPLDQHQVPSQTYQPLLLSEDEELPYNRSDDDQKVPVEKEDAHHPAQSCYACNGATEAEQPYQQPCAPADTDDDDITASTRQVAVGSTRRVSFEDEVRVYLDEIETEPASGIDVDADPRRSLQEGKILLSCDNIGCPRTAFPNSLEGKEYKQCHNCETCYCSRQCRRDAWELHKVTCDAIQVQNIIKLAINNIRRLPKVMDTFSNEARRGYISRGPGTVKMYFDRIKKAEQFLRCGAEALGKYEYIAGTDVLPGELEPALYAAMVDLCRNYNPENRFILYIVVCVETEIHPSRSGMPRMERKVVANYVKLRLTGEAIQESQALRGSPYRHLGNSATSQPLTLILKATPLPRYVDRARIFERVRNILYSRGISLRRQEPTYYTALQHYVHAGGTCSVPRRPSIRYDSITIHARNRVLGQPDIYIIMVDASHELVERVVNTSGLNVLVFDLINNTDEELPMILGFSEVMNKLKNDIPALQEPTNAESSVQKEAIDDLNLYTDRTNIGDEWVNHCCNKVKQPQENIHPVGGSASKSTDSDSIP